MENIPTIRELTYAMIEESEGMEVSCGSLLEYATDWVAEIEMKGYMFLTHRECPTLILKTFR